MMYAVIRGPTGLVVEEAVSPSAAMAAAKSSGRTYVAASKDKETALALAKKLGGNS